MSKKGTVALSQTCCPKCNEPTLVFDLMLAPPKYKHYVDSLDLRKTCTPYPLCLSCYNEYEIHCRKCDVPLSYEHYLENTSVSNPHEDNFEHCQECWDLVEKRERLTMNTFRVDRSCCPLCSKPCAQGVETGSVYERTINERFETPWPVCADCLRKWDEFCAECSMPVTKSPILEQGAMPRQLLLRCEWCHKRKADIN